MIWPARVNEEGHKGPKYSNVTDGDNGHENCIQT